MKPRITFGALRQPGNQAADADWTPACPHRMPRSALFVPRERCDQPQNPPATDRKITQRKWARGSGPGPGSVTGPGHEGYGLSGLGDGDGEAERLDLLDVVADL